MVSCFTQDHLLFPTRSDGDQSNLARLTSDLVHTSATWVWTDQMARRCDPGRRVSAAVANGQQLPGFVWQIFHSAFADRQSAPSLTLMRLAEKK